MAQVFTNSRRPVDTMFETLVKRESEVLLAESPHLDGNPMLRRLARHRLDRKINDDVRRRMARQITGLNRSEARVSAIAAQHAKVGNQQLKSGLQVWMESFQG